ncbi:hypothetical protein TNCV_4858551 [Trichonephila clavipes]|nr:hypothetical protein TNCV_4858551 [Trichonephila clavipes]
MYQLSSCGLFIEAAGGYNFAFFVTRITFTCSEIDITLRKWSKIITLDEHSSMTVRDIATVVGVGNSSDSRFRSNYTRAFRDGPRNFQESAILTIRILGRNIASKKKRKMWTQTENYS